MAARDARSAVCKQQTEETETSAMSKARTRVLEVHEGAYVFREIALRVVDGPDRGAHVASAGEEITIGTDRGNTLVLTDPTVSRHHLALSTTTRGLELRDLGSTNGTILGGYRVMHALLEPGALVRVGRDVVELSLGDSSVREELSPQGEFGRALGPSPAMRRVFALLERYAPSEATVLLEGETGTGKDVLAEAIHARSPRAGGPFEVVDCAAMPPGLIEAELFGHARGAFTDAVATRRGAFEVADGGTLFLDEVGELPPDVQPVLLRVLEKRAVQRVGETRSRPVDVRIVAATNRELRKEVNRGRFRADLYYRLAVLRVRVPPLRERRQDIPALVRRFLADLDDGRERPPQWIDDLVTAFARQVWPGNVRELRAATQRALLLDDACAWAGDEASAPETFDAARRRVLDAWEAEYVRELLERHGGNLSRASRAAQVSRTYLRRLAARHGLRSPGSDS
jgi:DNA-binding NtrC family response regulator